MTKCPEATAKANEAAPKATDPLVSQPANKENPHPAKA